MEHLPAHSPASDEMAGPWNLRTERTAAFDFDRSLHAPSMSRAFVGSTARSWGLGDVGPIAELLVSEIVTNAVEHGSSGGTVQVSALPAGLRVEVSDESPGRPVLQHPGVRDVSGRGLSIVDRLARWWGVDLTDRGKVVWFEVDDLERGWGA